MAEVKFTTPQGTEITRDIQSAEQITGFEKSGFKTVSNPFSTATPTPTPQPNAVDTFMTSREEQRKATEQQQQTEQKVKTEADVAGDAYNKKLEDTNKFYETQLTTFQSEFDNLSLASKQQNEALINSIRNTYANRISQMELINKGATGAITTAQIRSGRSRYAPELATGAISAEERAGVRRISDLDAEMNSQIAQAQQAATAKDFERLNAKMQTINDLKEKQTGALKEQYSLAKDFEDRANAEAKSKLETEQTKLEILDGNLDLYSSALLSTDADGNVMVADDETIQSLADELDIPVTLLKSRMSKQKAELSKLSQEDQKRELDIKKAQQELIPEYVRDFTYAKEKLGYTGTWQQFLKDKTQAEQGPESMPASYKEWELAGGQQGTGKSYAEYLGKDNGLDPKTITQIDSLSRGFDSSPIVKNYIEIQNKKMGIDAILGTGTVGGPQDVAIVYDFMKTLDPTSVVRETEYAEAAKSGNLFVGTLAQFNGLFKAEGGKLSEDVRQQFQNIVNQKLLVAESQYNNLYDETTRKINLKTGGVDGSDYLTQYKIEKPKKQYIDAKDFISNAEPEEEAQFNAIQATFPDKTPQEIFEFWREENGGEEMGGVTPEVSQKITMSFKTGEWGGQCGEFTHQIVDFPSMGNEYSEKQASVNRSGLRQDEWLQQGPKVGDVVITDASDVARSGQPQRYGHAAVVAKVLPNGDLYLIESNVKGHETISIGRTISPDDPAIYGALRGKIKQKFLA